MSIKGDVLPGGINQEIQGVTTQTRAHPDDFNPNVLKPLLDNDVTMSRQLETLPSEALTFRPGYQIVESEQDTPFRLGEIKGRTLVNLLGRAGACDDLSLLGSFQTINTIENETVKVIINKDGFGVAPITLDEVIKAGKYYLLAGLIKNGTAKSASLAFGGNEGGGPLVPVTNKEDLQFVYMKKTSTKDLDKVNIDLGVIGSVGQYAYFDSIRLYEISEAEYNAIDSMTPEQVESHYPYVDSVTNVKNPYAIVTGGNLLPPFYEWPNIGGGKKMVEGQYKVKLLTQAKDDIVYYLKIGAGVTMTLSVKHTGRIGVNAWDGNNRQIGGQSIVRYTDAQQVTFTTPDNTHRISVHFGNVLEDDSFLPECEFKNPILTIGTEPKSFTAQQRSMLAFETELAAHPIDGSNPDILFMGDDGLPCVLEKWKKFTPDSQNTYRLETVPRSPEFKTIRLHNASPGNSSPGDFEDEGKLFATKFDGQILTISDIPIALWTTSELIRINVDHIYISIANTDSGWGPDYTPTPDEIEAYFLGWKMYNGDTNPNGDGIFNDSGRKLWCYRVPGGGFLGSTERVPTERAPINGAWQPYRLQYLMAKPTIEPVGNYELGATLSSGSNMIEVGSGIVIREKVNPALYADNYVYLNNKAVDNAIGSNCSFRYKASTLLEIYKDRANEIGKWTMLPKHDSAYGEILALIQQSNFDPSAVYHVTYTMFNPTIAAPIRGTVAANLRGTVSNLVQDVGDIGRRLSVVETQKAEKDAPQWIDLSLLSGWKNVYTIKAGFYKNDNGIVHLRGRMSGGTLTNGTVIAKLPRGYGVTSSEHIIPVWDGTSGPIKAGLVTIKNNDVSIWNVPSDAKDIWLDDISFKTDQ